MVERVTAGLMMALALWGAIVTGVIVGVFAGVNPYIAGMIAGGFWTLWLTFVVARRPSDEQLD